VKNPLSGATGYSESSCKIQLWRLGDNDWVIFFPIHVLDLLGLQVSAQLGRRMSSAKYARVQLK
jgi:hypothetical protein